MYVNIKVYIDMYVCRYVGTCVYVRMYVCMYDIDDNDPRLKRLLENQVKKNCT
jgi:hypothetical protein